MRSKGETRIYEALQEAGVSFSTEYSFPDLRASSGRYLRFDFAVFHEDGTLDYLLEMQGRQHYEPVERFGGKSGLRRQQYNDAQKRKYCLRHGYTLVVVPYWDYDDITYDYIRRKAGYR